MTDHASTLAAPKPPQSAPEQDADDPKDKKCHYVPQFLLKKFVLKKRRPKQVLVLDKKTGEITPMSPEDICQVPNLYKTHLLDANLEPVGEANFDAETTLSDVENYASPVIKKIIRQARGDVSLDLDTEERKHVINFLRTLPLRSIPYNIAATKAAEDRKVHEAYKDLLVDKGSGVSTHEMVLNALKDYTASRLVALRNVEKEFPNQGLRVLRIDLPDMYFATGGVPFVCVQETPDIRPWIPIHPKVAVSFANQRTDSLSSPSRNHIRAMNRYMYDLWDETIVQSKEHAAEIIQTPESQIRRMGMTMLCIVISS